MSKIVWKKDYGDGYETDDSVLWINGKPTKSFVSQNSGIFYAYVNDKEIAMADTRKEAKIIILDELKLGC